MDGQPAAELLRIIEAQTLDARTIATRTAGIHAAMLEKSRYLQAGNFTRIHTSDLAMLFHQYDAQFFGGLLERCLVRYPLSFSLSKRMTSAGGKTLSVRERGTGARRFEIGVSTPILFGCFRADDHRDIIACGLACHDRLDALQRVMEHEITHLVEMLLWDTSKCSQPRFHSITRRFFGHTENKHQLITPKERAFAQYGIRAGMLVRFHFDGAEFIGLVNRVNKRATVLVEDPRGERYSNGKYYAKFYVPAQDLIAVEQQ